MRLEIGQRASRDLRELHAYGTQTYGPRAADTYLGELFGQFDHIAQWPFSARVRYWSTPPVRLSQHRAHNILYSVEDQTVTILRLFHHSVNWIDFL